MSDNGQAPIVIYQEADQAVEVRLVQPEVAR